MKNFKLVDVRVGYNTIRGKVPLHCHQDDYHWLWEKIAAMPLNRQDSLCQKYTALYKQLYKAVTAPHRKHNTARKECNIRLRNYIEKVTYGP